MPKDSPKLDPLFVDARREAIGIVVIFSIFAIVSLTTSLTLGWNSPMDARELREPNEYAMNVIFGMPLWVFWGVFVPWMFACFVSIWFAFFVMKDGSLGEEAGDEVNDGANAMKSESAE